MLAMPQRVSVVIEGAMETASKAVLCARVIAAASKL